MKRSIEETELKDKLSVSARPTGYMLPAFSRYIHNLLASKERDYNDACNLCLRLVQMGMMPPRTLIEQFYKALHGADKKQDACIIFQFFMQLAALPDDYNEYAWNWAPVPREATQSNLDNFTTTLRELNDIKRAQVRYNSILWLRYLVAVLQRDLEAGPPSRSMLRRLGETTDNTNAMIELILDALQSSINVQEDQRKNHKRAIAEAHEKHEARLEKMKGKDTAAVERVRDEFQLRLEEMEKAHNAAHVQSVEAVLLVQKLLSILLQSQPRVRVGRESSFDWTALMDKYREKVWNPLKGNDPRKASKKQRVLLSTTDDPYLLLQFTALFLAREFNLPGTVYAVEQDMRNLNLFLSSKPTAAAELLIELTYLLLRSFLRHRPQTSLEILETELSQFVGKWQEVVRGKVYCETILGSFQQFYFKLAE